MPKRVALFLLLVFACDIAMDSYCAVCCPDEATQPCAASVRDVHVFSPVETVSEKAPDVRTPRIAIPETRVIELLVDKSLFHPPIV